MTEVATVQIASGLSPEASERLLQSFSLSYLGACLQVQQHVPEPAPQASGARRFEFWLGEEQGLVVAVLGLRDKRHLYHLFVRQACQGRGLGRRLWEHCRPDGSPLSQAITVNSSLNAVGFYQRLGFEVVGPTVWLGGIPSVPLLWQPSLVASRD